MEPRTGFMPVLRTRLPEPSLVFVMPFCASAEAAHASMQTIANVNLMCPRFRLSCQGRSCYPALHSQTAVLGRHFRPVPDGYEISSVDPPFSVDPSATVIAAPDLSRNKPASDRPSRNDELGAWPSLRLLPAVSSQCAGPLKRQERAKARAGRPLRASGWPFEASPGDGPRRLLRARVGKHAAHAKNLPKPLLDRS